MSKGKDDFETKLSVLENICTKMSSDTLSLADGLALYERGIKLVKELETHLKSAERRVEQLLNEDFSDTAAEPRLQLFAEHDATEPPA